MTRWRRYRPARVTVELLGDVAAVRFRSVRTRTLAHQHCARAWGWDRGRQCATVPAAMVPELVRHLRAAGVVVVRHGTAVADALPAGPCQLPFDGAAA